MTRRLTLQHSAISKDQRRNAQTTSFAVAQLRRCSRKCRPQSPLSRKDTSKPDRTKLMFDPDPFAATTTAKHQTLTLSDLRCANPVAAPSPHRTASHE